MTTRTTAQTAGAAHDTSGAPEQTWHDRVEAVGWAAVRAGLAFHDAA
jgi:hypothetical protein